jgi:hypothetical protein
VSEGEVETELTDAAQLAQAAQAVAADSESDLKASDENQTTNVEGASEPERQA